VIKVKFVFGAAFHALAFIAPPNGKLDSGRNDSSARWINNCWNADIFATFNGDQTELENTTMLIGLLPGIDEMKYPVVSPNSRVDFFVDSHFLRWPQPNLGFLGGTMKFSVLR